MNNLQEVFTDALKDYEAGNLAKALSSLASLYNQNNDNPNFCYYYGNLLIDTGEIDLALQIYVDFINKNTSCYEIWFNLGYIFQIKNDLTNAIACYENVTRLTPNLPEPYKNLATIYHLLNQSDESEKYYEKLIAMSYRDFDVCYNLAVIYFKKACYDKALAFFNEAIIINPNDELLYISLGDCYEKLKDYDKAISNYSKTIALNDKNYVAYNNIGFIHYNYYKNYEKAAYFYEQSLNYLDESNTTIAYAIYNNMANIYYTRRDLPNAIKYYEKAYNLNQDDYVLSYNYGKTLILNGEYIKGFKFYDLCMYKYPQLCTLFDESQYPMWKGQSLKGKTIVVYEKAGFGDTFMFSRYIYLLKDLAEKVILLTKNEVHDLINYNFGDIVTVMKENEFEKNQHIDYQIPFLFCPFAFKTEIENIPSINGYLKPNPQRIEKFKKYFDTPKLKIGIAWKSKGDLRDIPFEYLNFLKDIKEIQVYSLQKDAKTEHLANIINLGALFDDFSDTCSAISQLDMVISTDMAVPNLSGSMGVPTFVLLTYQQDWRWGFNQEKSPWFNSVSCIVQDKNNDWESVINKLNTKLSSIIKDRH
ncbi:MAG: tetratricopeptide repeat protein [bacterium]